MPNDNADAGQTSNDTGNAAPAAPAPAAGTGPADTGTQVAAGTLTPEQQAAADKAATDAKAAEDATKAEADKAAKPEGAPEKYEFKLPEGQALDASVQTQFEAVAKELNLSQATAQKLLETMNPAMAAAQTAAMARVQTEWQTAARADKEFGGEQFDANLAIAKSAVDRFGTPEFKTYLNQSGLGNHPEMIRMMIKAGKAISEDKPGGMASGAMSTKSVAKALYPSSN